LTFNNTEKAVFKKMGELSDVVDNNIHFGRIRLCCFIPFIAFLAFFDV